MGVYIKGMEMPKTCVSCKLWMMQIIGGKWFDICRASDKVVNAPYSKPDWCPLIEVSEPHGRLGDLDRLEQMFIDIDNAPYSGFDGTEPFYSAEDAAQIIRLAPTVIPANTEEEKMK